MEEADAAEAGAIGAPAVAEEAAALGMASLDADASLDASVSEDLGSPITDGELQSLHRTPDDLRRRTPVADGGKSKPPSPSTSTPTKGGMQNDPTYAAAEKLFELAGVKIRQHTPAAVVDVTYH